MTQEIVQAYNRGFADGLAEAERRRAELFERVWATINDSGGVEGHATSLRPSDDRTRGRTGLGVPVPPSKRQSSAGIKPGPLSPLKAADGGNVVAIHHRRPDGKWHL